MWTQRAPGCRINGNWQNPVNQSANKYLLINLLLPSTKAGAAETKQKQKIDHSFVLKEFVT